MGMPKVPSSKGDSVSTPDHVENTGDNLRHAAEVQQEVREGETGDSAPSEPSAAAEPPLPDFNT